jgi:hypothetical protein
VKSVKKLLWVLWGLGWVLVPVTLKQLHLAQLTPFVMFSSLAALIVLSWHRGALLRVALRAIARRAEQDRATFTPPHARVVVGPQVRVGGAAEPHGEADEAMLDATGATELAAPHRRRARRD